ncbi:MAG TPA: glycosyltransferase family 2 protein [Propionibacteriaceae bacterium]
MPALAGDAHSSPIGIVVVNYACRELIEHNLGAVELVNARVVVVDNWFSSAEREDVRALTVRQGWTLVEMADNRGFGPGVNAGVRKAGELGCTTVLLLNPDVELTGDVIEQLRLQCLAVPGSLVSPLLVDLAGKVVFEGASLNLVDGRIRNAAKAAADPDPRSRPKVWLTGACLAVDRALWDWVGGFDEGYFMYWEDVDLNYRCAQAGARLILRRDLTAVHDQGGTQGPRRGRAKSALYYFYNSRNRMLFAVRHLSRREVVAWMVATPKVSYEIWLHGGRRQLLESPGLVLSAARGGLAGLIGGARFLVGR